MERNKTLDAANQIVELLTPMESEERRRVIQASLLLLGETVIQHEVASGTAAKLDNSGDEINTDAIVFPRVVQIWMKQNDVDAQQLEQVFLLTDGTAQIITSDIPGSDAKAKTINVYVLVGLSKMIVSGEPNFDDSIARQLCKDFGCFNNSNHSKYLAAKENKFVGSKETGWKLTSPGLKYSAELIRMMVSTK